MTISVEVRRRTIRQYNVFETITAEHSPALFSAYKNMKAIHHAEGKNGALVAIAEYTNGTFSIL